MPKIVGVRFRRCGKIYSFETDGVAAKPGMRVVVESEMGLSIGVVVNLRQIIDQTEQQFKKVLRIATVEDIESDKNNRLLEEEAKAFCIEKVKSRNLPMKVVETEATLDKKRLIFYFTAEGRVDFRELVRDLASKFKTRIEMRQIGVRDEVKHLGGIGICGKEVCCKTFLTSFEPVSIRMAKKQELVLNPGKLSGICGRLMCCLSYEIEQPAKEEIISIEKEDEPVVVTDESISEGESVLETAILHPCSTCQSSQVEATQFRESEIHKETIPQPQQKDKSEIHSEPEDLRAKKEPRKPHLPRKEYKDKGKPFSKRKKFWRKKKKR